MEQISNYMNEKYHTDQYGKGDLNIIHAEGYKLIDDDGNVEMEDGWGHAMIIMDTKDDITYVSSWGKRYQYFPTDGIDNPGYHIVVNVGNK